MNLEVIKKWFRGVYALLVQKDFQLPVICLALNRHADKMLVEIDFAFMRSCRVGPQVDDGKNVALKL